MYHVLCTNTNTHTHTHTPTHPHPPTHTLKLIEIKSRAAKRAAEDKEYARLRTSGGVDVDGEEGGGGVVGTLRRATESKVGAWVDGWVCLWYCVVSDGRVWCF